MTETEQDKMVVIKVLYQGMNWSFARIARIFSESDKTVKSIYMKALDEPNEAKLRDLPKSRRTIDLRYVGDTSDVEYLDGHIHHNVTGGGRKIDETHRAD